MEQKTMDHYFKKVLENNKDFNVRQFHSISYLDLKCLRDTIGGQVDLHPDVRKETDRIGDCCLLTFFESLSMVCLLQWKHLTMATTLLVWSTSIL